VPFERFGSGHLHPSWIKLHRQGRLPRRKLAPCGGKPARRAHPLVKGGVAVSLAAIGVATLGGCPILKIMGRLAVWRKEELHVFAVFPVKGMESTSSGILLVVALGFP